VCCNVELSRIEGSLTLQQGLLMYYTAVSMKAEQCCKYDSGTMHEQFAKELMQCTSFDFFVNCEVVAIICTSLGSGV